MEPMKNKARKGYESNEIITKGEKMRIATKDKMDTYEKGRFNRCGMNKENCGRFTYI